jgi:hypothetical protein
LTISFREGWMALHGMLFGAALLLAFAGGLAGLYNLGPEWSGVQGIKKRIVRLKAIMWGTALVAWCAVISGTFLVYPFYAASAPKDADLTRYPYNFLVSSPVTAEWHNFGMEWKEHVGWFAPMAATVVAFAVSYYGPQLVQKAGERRAITIFFVLAFATASIAGVFGAFITKVAPIR